MPDRNSVKSVSPSSTVNIAIAQRQGDPVCACPEPVVVQNGDRTVRFTPITKELIRIEDIGPGRQFVDDPTFFAMNRDRFALDLKVKPVKADGATVLDTGVMRLTFRPDGRPLHRGNLEIRTSPGAAGLAAAKPWRWHPEKRNEDQANLGGGFRTLDLFGFDIDQHGGLQLDNGILSRQGFFCYDDSRDHRRRAVERKRISEPKRGRQSRSIAFCRDLLLDWAAGFVVPPVNQAAICRVFGVDGCGLNDVSNCWGV
jgi:hypothetical protein